MKKLLLALFLLVPLSAQAQQAKVVASCGTVPLTYPAGSTQYQTVDVNGNLCTNASSSGGPVTVKSGSYVSAGTQQNALAITTNTQLTVPSGTTCAQITVESA